MNNPDAFERSMASLYDAMIGETRWPATSALIDEACGLTGNGRHCHVNRVGPQRPAWIPFQAAALALSHTLNASFRNRLNVSLLHK